ncbi:CPBP family intramembrane glutamic endopeptidase [Haloprofundus sp. MHR1]|uniref:CPBP family intramembrane glutamic endopeptidase n=1 Tax=Haloprofundus sp. MHR1 TaxID=2572921 RepID=UPI0010BF24E4|nr:CPBP family intramembrane glutamic endopeptidase [Haloprofundus sp. MHR1]QCJ45822.1 CPBP family intramembrane metalloprotease [Haloprofundus sp. MHR1]
MQSDPSPQTSRSQTHLQAAANVVFVVAGAFAVGIAVSLVGVLLLQLLGVSTQTPLPRAVLASLQYVGFGIAAYLYLSRRNEWHIVRWRVPRLRDFGWMVGGLVILVSALVGVSVVIQQLGIQVAANQVITTGQQNPVYFLYMIPVTMLFVGPMEELIFRGIVQEKLRRTYGPAVAVVVASAVFAVAHWLALVGSSGGRVASIAVIFVLGAVLALLYERTENLVVVAVVHGLFNSYQFLGQYAIATGLIPGA